MSCGTLSFADLVLLELHGRDLIIVGGREAVAVVVADRSLVGWESLIREAGAAHFIVSPRKLHELSEIILRHAAFVTPAMRQPAEQAASLDEQILAGLPGSEN